MPEVQIGASFTGNMKLPVHRWFRYSAGFSAQWVTSTLAAFDTGITVLDPFAGSGTAVIEGERSGMRAIGLESHPFVARIAQAKLCWDYLSLARVMPSDNPYRRSADPRQSGAKKKTLPALVSRLHGWL